jgi:hypothetical protein
MDSSPLYEVVSDQFKAVFMLGAEDDPGTVENVDAEVTLTDGTRWSATFISINEIQGIMDRWLISGECASGGYFQCPDLVIIREPGIGAMVRVIEQVLAEDGPRGLLIPLDGPSSFSREI